MGPKTLVGISGALAATPERTLLRVAVTAAVTLALLLICGNARGDGLSDIPAAFADVGVGAGPMGMAGAVSASTSGAGALFWNPAGLGLSGNPREVQVTYADQMGLVPYTAGAGLFRLGDYALGAGVLYSGDDVLSETTILLGASRKFTVLPWTDEPLSAGAALRTRMASFGNNQSAGEQVTGSALGAGVDLGVIVPVTPRTTFGICGRDVLSALSWDSSAAGSYSENIPAGLCFGVAMRPGEDLLLEVDLEKSLHADTDDVVRAGSELRLFGVAFARGGYVTRLQDNEGDEYTAGAGAVFPAGGVMMSIDVAYVFGRLDDTLRFSLGVGL